jgi:hypothetical protein
MICGLGWLLPRHPGGFCLCAWRKLRGIASNICRARAAMHEILESTRNWNVQAAEHSLSFEKGCGG